jgi:aquaporin Z
VKNNLAREAIAEFIGTFMLVFIGAGAVTTLGLASSPPAAGVVVAALAHGLILVAIVATFGSISGALVNPAITLGLLVGGKISLVKAIAYWIAQFAGGIVAALVLRYIFPTAISLGNTDPSQFISSNLQIVVIEGILTFFLTSTVYQAAVYGKAGPATPVVIGFTLAACILLGGQLTGASLNPARTLGPALVTGDLQFVIWYLVGTFGGGAIAGIVHTYLFPPAPAK